MIFNVGDKVRILPSAVDINVAEDEIGKIGIVLNTYYFGDMTIDTISKKYGPWFVREQDISPAFTVGQQLLFDFMEQ